MSGWYRWTTRYSGDLRLGMMGTMDGGRYRGLWTWGMDRVDTGYGRSLERELTGPYVQSLKGFRAGVLIASVNRYGISGRLSLHVCPYALLNVTAIVHEGIRGSQTGWPR